MPSMPNAAVYIFLILDISLYALYIDTFIRMSHFYMCVWHYICYILTILENLSYPRRKKTRNNKHHSPRAFLCQVDKTGADAVEPESVENPGFLSLFYIVCGVIPI